MSAHEIYDKRISVTILPRGDHPNRRKVQERPASLSYFNIRELTQVLNEIILKPFKPLHVFRFSHGRYIVRVYEDTDQTEEANQSPS